MPSSHLTATQITHERSCIPGAQASQWSLLQPAGLVCAARRDARAVAQALTLAAVELDWLPDSRHSKPGACAERVPGASQTQNAVAPVAYKEQRWGCLTSLDSGARLSAAPRLPPHGFCPNAPHPRLRLLHLGSSLRPQVVISKSRIAKHCLLADHLSDRLTLQEIICFSQIVFRFLFIDYHTMCW